MTFDQLDIHIPDGTPLPEALARTTHLAIVAHPDDLELLAYHGIAAGYQQPDIWFTGIVICDGAGSPRSGPFGHYSDTEMVAIRRQEQIAAAELGQYSAVIQLGVASAAVKAVSNAQLIDQLWQLLNACQPTTLYLHNFIDRHQTHVGCCLQSLAAVRKMAATQRPLHILGGELWRDLDWLPTTYKAVLDVSPYPQLRQALIGQFASQIAGGKQYDQAALARSKAHATFAESHQTDAVSAISFALDLMPLVADETLTVDDYWQTILTSFDREVRAHWQAFNT
ncbi:PIG-L deacetylase family protein [Halioxenophilus sp. WMMB6]|uniref:PIG-L deacetylase family protein n=1 Tax=Halioxenophilus sp. WMMB6 TaxID=3073815 RepID=UPI00295E50D3|nr:PIG-L family deacetylase [Halioxenophilus sp. WMMB6]